MKKKAIELSKTFFELEGESIFNDPEAHWWVNGWNVKYGEKSIIHKDFLYLNEDINKLAEILLNDLSTGFLDDLEYRSWKIDNYIGFITECFEKQLAIKTKVGYQLKILNA